jgi:S-adenosylmethionine synthetase
MFGYATNENEDLLPTPISLAHKLSKMLTDVRKSGLLSYLRPGGKSQVTVEYDKDVNPVRVDAVVISTQHSETISTEELRADILKHVIQATLPSSLLGIIESLDLRRPIYRKTAVYGRFGRADADSNWEATDKGANDLTSPES